MEGHQSRDDVVRQGLSQWEAHRALGRAVSVGRAVLCKGVTHGWARVETDVVCPRRLEQGFRADSALTALLAALDQSAAAVTAAGLTAVWTRRARGHIAL